MVRSFGTTGGDERIAKKLFLGHPGGAGEGGPE